MSETEMRSRVTAILHTIKSGDDVQILS
jgi:hypothetical protein